MCQYKLSDRFLVGLIINTCLQIGNQTFLAHILYNLLGCVECALVLVVLQQVLEYTSQHFGIVTDLEPTLYHRLLCVHGTVL